MTLITTTHCVLAVRARGELKVVLPAVIRFIFAQGHAKIWAKIMAVRDTEKQTNEESLKKVG